MARIITIVLITLCGSASAQFTSKYKMVQGGLSFSPGYMLDNVRNIYVSGFLRYYVQGSFSVRGDGYYFLNSLGDNNPLRLNHQLFAGGFYHLNSPGVDPYIGFQPGLAYSARNDSIRGIDGLQEASAASFNPLTSFVFGFNYFGSKHFSLFVEARFIRGIHMSNSLPKYLDELRLSFGLALQLGGTYKNQ